MKKIDDNSKALFDNKKYKQVRLSTYYSYYYLLVVTSFFLSVTTTLSPSATLWGFSIMAKVATSSDLDTPQEMPRRSRESGPLKSILYSRTKVLGYSALNIRAKSILTWCYVIPGVEKELHRTHAGRENLTDGGVGGVTCACWCERRVGPVKVLLTAGGLARLAHAHFFVLAFGDVQVLVDVAKGYDVLTAVLRLKCKDISFLSRKQ